MNSRTKIVVIHMKELIIGGIIFLVAVVAAIALIMSALQKDTPTKTKSMNTGSISKDASPAASSSTITPDINTAITDTDGTAVTEHTYTPGVYTASASLNGNPVDIQVTVDKHNINSIELIHISDAVTTMYPLLQSNFDTIANSVMLKGSTENITFNSDNKYTSDLLLNAIQNALNKCTVE